MLIGFLRKKALRRELLATAVFSQLEKAVSKDKAPTGLPGRAFVNRTLLALSANEIATIKPRLSQFIACPGTHSELYPRPSKRLGKVAWTISSLVSKDRFECCEAQVHSNVDRIMSSSAPKGERQPNS